MATSQQTKRLHEFGRFRLNPSEHLLLCDGQVVPLPPKVFDTLLALVENSGRLIEKDELMARLWPDTFVEEATLARNISDLRKALGESSGETKFVETIPKRGYRFIANVTVFEGDSAALIVKRYTRSRVVVEEEVEMGAPPRSIAVLPFKPLGQGDDEQYLGLGLADALITRLSNIRQVIVRPTSAVFKFADARQDPVVAARELKVEWIVDGSIQRSGDRIRVTVQLVSIKEDAALWADKFDEKFTDIFAVEDSISEQVLTALTLKLTSDERRLLTRRYTENIEAYQEYLKGRYYLNKRTTKWIKKAAEHFQQAIDIDPGYATAHAGVADSYTLLVTFEVMPPAEGFPKAKAAARRALQIEPALAEAHTSLGHVLLHAWEWEDSERAFQSALALNPRYAPAHQWYAEYLAAMARFDEAIGEMLRARELDPLSLVHNADVGWALYYARRYDEAVEQLRHTIEMDPDYWSAHHLLGQVYTQKAMHAEAIAELHTAMNLSGRGPLSVLLVGHAYAVGGQRGEALEVLDKLYELAKQRYFSPYRVALIHAGLGDDDQAFNWLERAYEIRDARLILLGVDPVLDGLRLDARFADLLRRVGLGQR